MDVGNILRDISKRKGEEELFGLKVAELEDAIELNRCAFKGGDELLLRCREHKIERTFILGEAGPVVEGSNFLIREDL